MHATKGSEVLRATDELERFFALSLDLLCIASADGYFKRVNPAVTDVLGWSTEEFLGRPFLEFVHPDDQSRTLLEVDKQVRRGEKVQQFENRYRHRDGGWPGAGAGGLYVGAAIKHRNRSGQPDGYTARDVLRMAGRAERADGQHSVP